MTYNHILHIKLMFIIANSQIYNIYTAKMIAMYLMQKEKNQ